MAAGVAERAIGTGTTRRADAHASAVPVTANPAYAVLGQARHVLLLQGPVGPFFDRLTGWLQLRGARVTRVLFQGGDRQDCRAAEAVSYTGPPADWPAWLRRHLQQERPGCILLFGQSRLYHQAARAVGAELGVPVIVLEEGYFRPGYVTMEVGGVNSHSTTIDAYRWASPGSAGSAPDACGWHFQQTAWHAARHYAALWLRRAEFPAYLHHRSADPLHYAAYWLRSWGIKLLRTPRDALVQRRLVRGGPGYFFVPLQHDGDSQITHHSGYSRNAEFILEVLHSFAAHAGPRAVLVFKQHPQSRGGPGHAALIRQLARGLGLGGRVLCLVEGDTRVLTRHAAGVVLINSTVGLQALERGTPVMVMGEALYKRPDLTPATRLDDFWGDPPRPDPAQVAAFLQQLKNLTQMPASIYAGRDAPLAWR